MELTLLHASVEANMGYYELGYTMGGQRRYYQERRMEKA